jgi:GT2 family glycosyltransferase
VVETLHSLAPLTIGGGATASPSWRLDEILVIDNDAEPSALDAVTALVEAGFPHQIRYEHEPRPGLAAARNRALDEVRSRILVFIDDDELAEPGWPGGLIETMTATGAALVGGPVRTRFAGQPPGWIVAGGFFDRPEPGDRSAQTWLRSGNLAIDVAKIAQHSLRFDDRFGLTGGEDVAFSTMARRLGLGLRWCSTAAVTERVGSDRTRLGWILARERNSTANWVRAELAWNGSAARRLLIAGRGTARIGQGAVMALAGLVTLRLSRMVRGLVKASRGVGSFQGLFDRHVDVYGSAAAESSGHRRRRPASSGEVS